jgi:predicted cupin superfamily sugar epimerase
MRQMDPRPDNSDEGLRIAARLGLEPLPFEGGVFRRTYSSPGMTAIYFLVAGQDFSAIHRMRTSDELFLFHAGAPLRMLLLGSGQEREETIGSDVQAGLVPQLLVPSGIWQGAASTGGWSLVSTVVVPGFDWDDFQLGDRADLTEAFPDWAQHIAALTR